MRILGVFAKQPIPGRVKTRLASQTSPEWAARAAGAFLWDTLDRLAVLDAERVVVFAPSGATEYFAQIAADRYTLTPQGEGDLGLRMKRFAANRLDGRAHAVVLVGADSPTLPPAFVDQAFRELERADVILGPATDGGYYLLGCRSLVPELFENVSWGTSDVLRQTALALRPTAWKLTLLPPWYDVDTLDDWKALRGHLTALHTAGIDPETPHTEDLPDPPDGEESRP